MRTFKTGATRDDDTAKLDYDGFLSPCALERYAEYMNEHRVQADGKLRDSDNWQKGIPEEAYVKSMFRHFLDVWRIHRGWKAFDPRDGHEIDKEEALCAVIFNAMGLLHVLTDFRVPKLEPEPMFPRDHRVSGASYFETCGDCKYSPRSCRACADPLQDPCPCKEEFGT